MSEAVHSWIEQASLGGGVIACGVRTADHSFSVRSGMPELPRSGLEEVMRTLAETSHALRQNRITPQFICWTFENLQIRCVAREDGAMAAVLANRGEDTALEADQLLALFLQPG